MNTSKSLTVKNNLPNEPIRLTRRIGSVTYEVELHFNPKAKETMNDKKLRLVKRELWGPRETLFRGVRTSDGVGELSLFSGSEQSVVREDAEAVS